MKRDSYGQLVCGACGAKLELVTKNHFFLKSIVGAGVMLFALDFVADVRLQILLFLMTLLIVFKNAFYFKTK